ncbi:MAG: hypothetical protein CMM50_02460 [Rhodospirillaceae bacterium]|nr:hypothetical protein [Rhodospirillaceae bacterium]
MAAAIAVTFAAAGPADAGISIYGRGLADEPVPYLGDEELPPPTPPILLFGNPFLSTGPIDSGFELPTGAVWQPSLWVFGTYRTALQSFDPANGPRVAEWANTLDLYANLQLSATERVLLGMTPFRRGTSFSGYRFDGPGPDDGEGFESFNGSVQTLFFEGDFGEIFPGLDRNDSDLLDYGFTVGRQALSFQQGLLMEDTAIDAVGIVRNSLTAPGIANIRLSGLFAWGEISRADAVEDNDAKLFGFSGDADIGSHFVSFDSFYVESDDDTGDGFYFGAGTVQRKGLWDSAFRLMGSIALDDDTPAVRSGVLGFMSFSTTPKTSDDILYINAFVARNEFTQVARDPVVGGPLGRAGILFSTQRLGQYGAPLSPRAKNVAGFTVGRQWFLVPTNREQLIVEFGGRVSWDDEPQGAGVAARYQIQIHNQAFLQFDLFGTYVDDVEDGFGVGARSELQIKF